MCDAPRPAFEQRSHRSWFRGLSQARWVERTTARLVQLEAWERPPRLLLLQSDPTEILAGFMAAAIAQCPLFLGNPGWKQQELDQAQAIAQPHLIWADSGDRHCAAPPTNLQEIGWIMIPTGGTSGKIKFAIHTWDTLSAAVAGMQQFFFGNDPQPIHSCCVLPLHHVSGLMQFMRSLLTGGELVLCPFADFLQGVSPDPALQDFLNPRSTLPQSFFLSLVPTQLYRWMQHCQNIPGGNDHRLGWLAQFYAILLGGAPASSQLLHGARQAQLPLAPTYGMTETAAQVMTLKPQDFLAGKSPPGAVLPHVQLTLVGDMEQTQMQWSGRSLFWGYYPQRQAAQQFLSDDRAEAQPNGHLKLLGRVSRKIISGGENIYPEEVEAVMLAMPEIQDVCVFGVPDPDWGERVVAAYVSTLNGLSPCDMERWVRSRLAAYKCPKQWWKMERLPRNAQGKLTLATLTTAWINRTSPCE
ncbi:AMP-binding protein [Lyngbya confervoides]|uniref:AMP-binding protein n=1 Tax=Lyngbya confervoides BDU141951 TaxID=1574623 RepID=A0ABD4T5C7_9CYAN|nr:AMP-binding protein [Lyngbya confervoides]MCM1983991.1 AMP-binding protein [Lyngbya confervoides BDU141951]